MYVRILESLTSNSLFLALNSALVVIFSYILYDLILSPLIVFVAFLATLSVYSLNKVTDRAEDAINRPKSASKSSAYYLAPSIVAFASSLIIGAIEGLLVVLIVATPLIIGVIYSVKFFPSLPRLKEIVGVKSIAVAFSWALTGSLLPVATHSLTFEKIMLVFIYIFIQLMVNTILFDYLDIKGDHSSGVKTIPIVLGKTKTRNLLLLLNSLLWLWIAYCLFNCLFISYLPALIFGITYSYCLIWLFLYKTGKRFYADLIVDGEWIPIVAILKTILSR